VVIEPLNKGLKIYDNPLGVVTNSPTFDWHMTNLRNYINLSATNVPPVDMGGITLAQLGQGSGLRGLPGDFTPPSRFVRAVAFSQSAVPSDTAQQAVLQAFHILNNFDIPYGAVRQVDSGQMHAEATVWTSASDLKNLRWYFRTYDDQSIRSIDLMKAMDAAHGQIKFIKMSSRQPATEVSTNFR
jgi:choloylglycine hydrolase